MPFDDADDVEDPDFDPEDMGFSTGIVDPIEEMYSLSDRSFFLCFLSSNFVPIVSNIAVTLQMQNRLP